jgi:hypothetical protein
MKKTIIIVGLIALVLLVNMLLNMFVFIPTGAGTAMSIDESRKLGVYCNTYELINQFGCNDTSGLVLKEVWGEKAWGYGKGRKSFTSPNGGYQIVLKWENWNVKYNDGSFFKSVDDYGTGGVGGNRVSASRKTLPDTITYYLLHYEPGLMKVTDKAQLESKAISCFTLVKKVSN